MNGFHTLEFTAILNEVKTVEAALSNMKTLSDGLIEIFSSTFIFN